MRHYARAMVLNEFGQPVGEPVDWSPGEVLVATTLAGRTCLLEPLGEAHLDGLYAALCLDSPPSLWTYLSSGPFADREGFATYVDGLRDDAAVLPLAIVQPNGSPVGIAAYLRIDHANGTAEIGHLSLASVLQRTTAATEAMYLMARACVRRGRGASPRVEVRLRSTQPSRRAAARLGFTYEGTFRRRWSTRRRNRDTAWFASPRTEWPGTCGRRSSAGSTRATSTRPAAADPTLGPRSRTNSGARDGFVGSADGRTEEPCAAGRAPRPACRSHRAGAGPAP